MGKKRRFTIVDYPKIGDLSGLYIASSPMRAASKVLTRIGREINLKNSNNKNHLVFKIRDIDSGKEYAYIGTRVELFKPTIVKIGKKTIVHKFKNILSKFNGDNFSNTSV